jgi:aspartyl-tRNA(Asn)/glutamyl-tRNA(Gln) amidotransferase subunit C
LISSKRFDIFFPQAAGREYIMMDRELVLKIARLARLKLSDEEIGEFAGQLGSIIDYVQQLEGVDAGSAEPTCFVEPLHDPSRGDTETSSLSQEEALRNGPRAKKGFFAVPKVIDGHS